MHFSCDEVFVARTEEQLQQRLVGVSTIGIVPTMGALHEGHITLIDRALEECEIVVTTIFVNPTQFNNPTDLEKYPRDLSGDLEQIKKSGCQVVFAPEVAEVYPDNRVEPTDKLDLGDLESMMEGTYRPGHFKGVAQVVNRLFELVKPTSAYFGIKDYQQVIVVEELVKFFDHDIKVVACETKRDSRGLAMSSRNRRLSPEGIVLASNIYKSFGDAEEMLKRGVAISEVESAIQNKYKTLGIEPEYFEIRGSKTLQRNRVEGEKYVACMAAYIEGVRLIDNLTLNV